MRVLFIPTAFLYLLVAFDVKGRKAISCMDPFRINLSSEF